ncbi:hypothetical protein L211DRAFT_119480 [Terfezia boudieri ATCC MYA-4762]|uniref:Serine-rich protein n=1 Tax=Terfezia boudieri ATCC MYA-4762 TaxID=1051890 RepID=A0A3N4LUY7_9PEZI|nr:hypothetical protein L211DRAFT_119480 [Terfezia boudieri ATCC MYA-4762]
MSERVSTKDDNDPFDVSKPPAIAPSRDITPSGPPTKPWSSSKPTTPTSIANSSLSFDSLPPVPPLHISKIPPLAIKKEPSRGSVSTATPPGTTRLAGLEQFYYGSQRSSRPSIYVDTVARKESSSSLRNQSRTPVALLTGGPRPLPEEPTPSSSSVSASHTGQPSQASHSRQTSFPRRGSFGYQPGLGRALPKPILKRTNYVPPGTAQGDVYIPPQTAEEYHERRNSWVEKTLEQRYNYSRMNGRSLRIVRTSEEEEARDELTEIIPQPSTRPVMTDSPPPSRLPDSAISKPEVRKKRSLQSILSRRDSVSEIPSGIPSWARYFYSKDEVPLPEEEDKPAPGFGPGRPDGRLHSLRRMASARLLPSKNGPEPIPNDPEDGVSRWSYPHLERSKYPLSPVEHLENRQLMLFCLGFILPFCWIIGALLPLPGPRPMWKAPIVSGDGNRDGYRVDVEAALNCTFEQERIFLSHEYWRKVNRGMSAVGVVLTGAIIALTVVAVKMG